ncbi:iron complex transport system substrate-binding protein [Planifilum fulgidum]|jgi:iron complex transport system substrate-binding protein|uniref:Iron complex transport system substrate-binding protein n=1 Tax=Planifilum fulgidum TaxID=201973 RepID=A0A1I2RWR8_9BACL|nr:siderophore ABC transporter substrate-binding protein [Planifilum fulgidum]MBO2534030.1 ABC transporter [Thermoactinomycetaceae bacterium]SFG44940.1 iron complex transport system substrate-binding protein [Planifilum fulgidum]
MVRLRKLLLGSLMLALVLSLAACGSSADTSKGEEAASQESEEIVVKHQLGETKVKKNPKNVVVFDFGVLDSLDKLGVEVAGVPQANIPPYLKKYGESKYANVGSLKEPDFEKVSSLGPELIIISARQADQYEEFSKIAPTIFMGVDTSRYMESFTENMETLGKIFGKEAEVEKELKAINETIEKVKKKASASDKKALIILTTGGKTSAFGPGSRFGLIHDVLGVKPVDNNIKVSTHGMSVTFEYIAEKNPDYLFVVDRDKVVSGEGGQPAEQVLNNDLVKGTKAYKDKNIVYLDPNYWYLSGGGLISLSEMVKEVEAALQ